jgi:hypothetical protein
MLVETLDRGGIAPPGRVPQFFGLATQLVEIRPVGK